MCSRTFMSYDRSVLGRTRTAATCANHSARKASTVCEPTGTGTPSRTLREMAVSLS
ncbi:MAG: hypothetical protein ACJ768_06685 [Gaiellaceae bacterium]